MNRLLDDLYRTRVLTNNGPYAVRLEKELERRLGVKHVVLVSSATVGLQLVIRALGLSGEVIVPSFTFVATAHSVLWDGLTPVFADIERDSWTLDVESVRGRLSPRTSAVIGVHLFGNPCDIERLSAFCAQHNLPLIFDSAQALGSIYRRQPVGRFGVAEVFSLHATKIVNSLEGGFIATSDSDLCERLRLMRNFGFSGYDKVDSIGINAKMNELCAGVGLRSLRFLEPNVERNLKNHALYKRCLRGVPGLSFSEARPGTRTSGHYFPIRVSPSYGLTRDQLCDVLWKENVISRRNFYPGCHRQEPYRSDPRQADLPVTDEIANSILVLPSYVGLPEKAIRTIADIVRRAHAGRHELQRYYATHPLDPSITAANRP